MLKQICRITQLFNFKLQFTFRANKFIVINPPKTTNQQIQITDKEIISFLKNNNINYRIQRSYVQLQFCPFCVKKNFEDLTNQYTMGINLKNGTYKCFRSSCQSKGNWSDYIKQMNSTTQNVIVDGPIQDCNLEEQKQQTFDQKYEKFMYHLHHQRLKLQQPKEVYEYLVGKDFNKNQRGIDNEILIKYMIGIGQEEVYNFQTKTSSTTPLVYFPMFRQLTYKESQELQQQSNQNHQFINDKYELVSCKLRGIGKENKHIQKIEPKNAMKGIFGLNILNENVEEIIITEGEFDAMAANQMTKIPSISLPYGISHYPNFLTEWLNQYRKLRKIYIWVDDDEIGRQNSNKIAEKIGFNRTQIIQPSLIFPQNYPKDANDCLRYFSDQINKIINIQ